MSFHTVIGQRLELLIQKELSRMDSEWFLKWHFIGKDGPVEIESFRAKPIYYGGIAFSGTPVDVYWDTISRYQKIKVSELFEFVEVELPKYPKHVREQAISEAVGLITMFASSIQRRAIEKDRILRGDGFTFPAPEDRGRWEGSSVIDFRAKGLLDSYCELDIENGGKYVMERMMNETLSFLKADGSGKKDGVKGLVADGTLFTFDTALPVQPNDRFLRELPSGLVEEYIVIDPGYQGGVGRAIKPHYQAKVRRSDQPAAPSRTIINNIQGANARVNIDSVDYSQNLVFSGTDDLIFQKLREQLAGAGLSARDQVRINSAIDEMEASTGTPAFKEKYKGFMSAAADHASVFGTLLAALSMLV